MSEPRSRSWRTRRFRSRRPWLSSSFRPLTLVNVALNGPRGTELKATLRQRFRLAIVDEFQDTDQIQWAIFRTIFDDRAARPLYLVGDPKQAIYGFRGADVATYVEARETVAAADEAHHLTRNFRSTRAVIDAYNAILDQTAAEPFFNHGDVSYDPPVTYGPDHDAASSSPRGAVCSPIWSASASTASSTSRKYW